MARWIGGEGFGTGPRAALRRMDLRDPDALAEPALQCLLVQVLPVEWSGRDVMRDWALLAHLLALSAPGLHVGGGSLGAALQAAGFSESRLLRLLGADRDTLTVLLPRACRFLAAKAQRLNPAELIRLIRAASSHEPEVLERMRTEIARGYYRAQRDEVESSTHSQAETT
jgi:CRISPR system Cascade subunit CasB